MQVGSVLITETAEQVFEELRQEVWRRGLRYFADARQNSGNIMTQCPFHKSGMERNPSFGISKDSLVCHCFTCGWSGGLDSVISEILFHVRDGGESGQRWLARRFTHVSIGERPKPLLLPEKRQRVRVAKKPRCAPFTEQELAGYRFYHDYMFKRGLTNEIIERFDVGYDKETDCITFPVYHVDSTPAFVARRSVQGKYFNYPENVDKPVYAADKLPAGTNSVLVTESIFNCLTAWKFGITAISLLGLGTDFQYQICKRLQTREFVLAFDPDPAGYGAAERFRRKVTGKLIRHLQIPQGYDLNDLDEKILELSTVF